MVDILDPTLQPAQLEPFTKLDKDLKTAATTLTAHEARYLVDAYYQIQSYRIRFGNQIHALAGSGEPHELTRWMYANVEGLENNVRKALDTYSKARAVGQWARSIPGIGPVIASGLLAHIDITKAPTAGHIWSFAGMNPAITWNKGQKRPWNADLKRLCFLVGESFIKVQNRPNDIYGHVYAERKRLEIEANDAGFYAEQAASELQRKRYGKDTDAFKAYSSGKLPPAHIHARARRFAVKLFLAHLQHVMYEDKYGKEPAQPYVISHLNHAHYIKPPLWPLSAESAAVADEDEVMDGSEIMLGGESEPPVPVSSTSAYPTLAERLRQFKQESESY